MYFVKDDVVISGVGGYFPKALNIEQLRDRLLNNEILLESRWKAGERGVTNVIGKVPSEFFDNAYFGIHRQQCTFMDPMHRLILERTYEAIIDAGVNPVELRGRRIGCFMASSVGENDNLFLESVISGFGVTGHSRAMMPNRVSYWLDLKGPSVAYDSNWVGGIEVLRLGYEAIKTGQCEAVIVGTANLALNSEFQWLYNDMGLLSPDGSNKAYDADAQGYARSDGIVVLYLQRSSEARRCYASVLNVATQFDGNREGTLLDIDANNMAEFIGEFYEKVDVDPSEVEFVEAYGSALKETDRKELEALEKVYCKNRKGPLLVGTVKPNTGHSEASASLFSVVKALIAMETETIPATLQYKNPNPEILPLVNGKIQIVTENLKWGAKYAAVNAIGLDSYYGHILLRGNQKKKTTFEVQDGIPRLILASTRTEAGIKELLETIKSRPMDPEYIKLIQDVYSKPILGHLYRGYTLLGAETPKEETEYHLGNKRQIWFVFSGMGSQWCNMLGDLMKIPVFANAINKCQEILKSKGVDLLHIITTSDKTIYENILHSFVGIAAIQIALTDCLKSIGIVPDGIIGHSVGELGCAYADGCMTAEEMILSAHSRGRASIETELIRGMMAAIGMGYEQIKNKCPPSIEVACHNGPDSSTISGPTEDMEKFVKELQDQGVFARLVNVSNIAYHSRYIKPAAPTLLKYLKEVLKKPVARSSKWISTSNLEENWDTDMAKYSSPEYHTNNLLSSVYFEEGLRHIPKDSVLIEIAPHGLLQAILKRSLKSGCTNVPLTQRGAKSGTEFLLGALGKLYLAGLDMDVSQLFPPVEYPVSRATACLANLAHWEHSETWRTGLEEKLKSLYGVRDYQVTLNSEEFRDCVGHQIDDKIILPCSSYLNTIFDIIASITTGHKEYIFENLHFRKALTIPRVGSVSLHAMIQKGSGDFEILVGNDLIVTGRLTLPSATDKLMSDPIKVEITKDDIQLSGNDVYNEFQHRGQKYSGAYRNIKNLSINEDGSVAIVQWTNKWPLLVEAMIQQHIFQDGERYQEIYLPKNIHKIVINQEMLPNEKTEVEVQYNFSTGMISTDGIQLVGLKAISLPKDPKAISFDSVEFTALSMTTLPSIENGINMALQLTLDNFQEQFMNNINITEIESQNPSLLENIQTVCNQYSKLQHNISTVKDIKEIIMQNSYPFLLILNDIPNEEVFKLIASCHGFLLARSTKSALSQTQIIQVAQFNADGVSYSIFRRVKDVTPSSVIVKGDTLSIKDLSRSSVTWVNELQHAITSATIKKNSIFLITSLIPAEGIKNFVEELITTYKTSPIRVLFILDKRIIDINVNDFQLQQIFKLDLTLSVIKDGILGTILPVPVKIKGNIQTNLNIASDAIKNTVINYVGINLKDETLLPATVKKCELGNVDYSGVTNSGHNVMGLAYMSKEECKLVPDSIFSWDVPKEWSLEDAATIPHAYVSAYYCLFEKARLEDGETVLIHAGCTSIGLAAISIAYAHNCTVYTTVSTDWQRSFLKKQFSKLDDDHIYSSDDSKFEALLLMATDGVGAQVIINNLSGNLLQSSVECLADYGRLIQIGKYDLEENNSFGMSIFLKNTSFYVVALENVFSQPKDVKQDIKAMVQKGIESGTVKPINRKVVEHQDVAEILQSLSNAGNIGKIIIKINKNLSLSKFILNNPLQFICDSKNSYLIYGGSSENWIDVVEWLILRGARKIVISSDSKPLQTYVNRRLCLLQYYFGAEILYISPKAYTREGAIELLSEVYLLGPVHCVFLLPTKSSSSKTSEIKAVQYIDLALRNAAPKAILINAINNAAGLCQIRSEANFPTYNIQWQQDLEFSEALEGLDQILSYRLKDILVKNDKISDSLQETAQLLFQKLTLMLPTSLEDFIDEVQSAPSKPDLIQLQTLGPREMRELSPVFVIPGLAGNQEMRNMAFQLLYPTFCAVYPSTPMSIKELAVALVEKIKKVWPKGAYNIIGVSWGGALMVEIAKILDKQGASLHLYFIDAAPETLQSAVKHLGESVSVRETNLLTRVLKISNSEVIKQIEETPEWEDRLQLALNSCQNISDKKTLGNGLLILKTCIESLLEYEPDEDLVSGQIHLIRPTGTSKYDNCGLVSYCKQTPQITLVTGDHLSIINNLATTEYINEKHYLI